MHSEKHLSPLVSFGFMVRNSTTNLEEFLVPLSDNHPETFPEYDVGGGVSGLLSVSLLESGKIDVFAATFGSIILHEKLFVVVPPRCIC